MSGSILQVTSASSAPGKSGSSSGPQNTIGVVSSSHKVSHSGSCQQPHGTPKPANSTSSANHKRNNQGAIFSMGIHGVDLVQKPAQKTTGARTPSSTNVVRDGSYRQFSKEGSVLQSKDAPCTEESVNPSISVQQPAPHQ